MHAARCFTDEDIYAAVAPSMRGSGYDIVSAPETGRLGCSDEEQLTWAAQQGRTLITFNVGHFAALHRDWLAQNRTHAGIVVSQQRALRDLLKRLRNLLDHLNADALKNRLEFLGDW